MKTNALEPYGHMMHYLLVSLIMVVLGSVAPAQDMSDYPIQALRSLHLNYWFGKQSGNVLDAERYVVGDVIALKSRSVGKGSYGLALTRPDAHRVEATFNVHSARARACGGGAVSAVSAQLTLAAFNTNGWGTPGNATGDVRAILAAQRRSTQSGEDETVSIAYMVATCPDAACNLSELDIVQSGDLGAMPFDVPTKLMVGWDHATNRFYFQVGSNAWVYTRPYRLTEGFRPGVPQESITIEHDVAQACTAPGSSRMDVSVTNVKVAALRLMTDKLSYAYGEPVYVSYTGMRAWDTSAFIGIDKQGVAGYSQSKYLTYGGTYLSTGAGSAAFIRPPSNGTYTARYFDGAGSLVAETPPFTVGANAGAKTVAPAKSVYATGETITASYAGLSNYQNWIAVATTGAPLSSYVTSTDTWSSTGEPMGRVTLSGVPAGNYVLRAFHGPTYTLDAQSAPFIVRDKQTIFGEATPTGSATDASVELGVKFRSTVAGQVMAIRVYRPVDGAAALPVRLWTSGGTLLASAAGEMADRTGWQTLSLASPISIAAHTTYIASYHCSAGNAFSYTAAQLYNAVTSGNLTAMSSASAGGNGVYAYGAPGTFPTATYNGNNYFVDIEFLPGS